MKWFKHESDAYTNLKLQQIIMEFGMDGYGLFWICLELVAQQSANFRLEKDKMWKPVLAKNASIGQKKTEEILNRFGELNLIDAHSLKRGHLYIPKLAERADEYTASKLRTLSRHSPDTLPTVSGQSRSRLEQIRIEEKRGGSPGPVLKNGNQGTGAQETKEKLKALIDGKKQIGKSI